MVATQRRRCGRKQQTTPQPMISSLLSAALIVIGLPMFQTGVEARLADRSRVIHARTNGASRRDKNNLPIEGAAYRMGVSNSDYLNEMKQEPTPTRALKKNSVTTGSSTLQKRKDLDIIEQMNESFEDHIHRNLGQLTGCCSNNYAYSADEMCAVYGQDCESGETPSHDSGDEECTQDGLSFIGISFSVNVAHGNAYSYQLCDQFAMENIIDRNYDYVMSMDEDGWLVGGGYKSFDYSGKMPYIDSSHTELLRVGSMDVEKGGTSIEQVYSAMESVYFAPISIFPEKVKGGGGGHSGDDDGSTPSGDVTLGVSVVETYTDNANYGDYETFLDNLFNAFSAVSAGSCMDDSDTDPHVSMSRGVKFKSSEHQEGYFYSSNLEVAVWQAMYPNGVIIGSSGYASFPAGSRGNKQYVGYGNLYFFFDRANITKAFRPGRDLSDDEATYSTLYSKGYSGDYYESTTEIDFDYSGSHDDGGDWEHNPYKWNAKMAMHDMTDGWDLPPNCEQEGETFLGIPLSRKSDSSLMDTSTFQEQFDFSVLMDTNYTYITSFGTNHGWLIGEVIGNGVGSIVDKDTAHIPLFYTGTTNPDMGGIGLSDLIKIVKKIQFGTLYIKPAFVFIDGDGHIKMQFEADANSALGYLYDSLCKELGISWNYDTPYNSNGVYTNCAMHAAGDRAKYGCGNENSNQGGFCPQMTIAYSARFNSEDDAAAYLAKCNGYIDYWRSLYPSGVAVGTSQFCSGGGCLGLFLNRYDLFYVFKPDLGGSWVEYGGASMAPTISPAPTAPGGCDSAKNYHLDRCMRKNMRPRASAVVWDSLGTIGQFSLFMLVFMSATLSVSIFLARARKRRKPGESYLDFFVRDATKKRGGKKKKKKVKKKSKLTRDLEKAMLEGDEKPTRSRSKSVSKSKSGRSKSRDRTSRSKSRSRKSGKSKSRSKSKTRQQLV
mmetsp:Transcript_22774/g.45734  ORF Transcript_22774/g.45734 Transcript_22774/m.45734 type:complete len:940 (-) Transcript_22774:107-2926(-)